MSELSRRDLLVGTALVFISESTVRGSVIKGQLPWQDTAGSAPKPIDPEGWRYFTPAEAATVEALADRIIPKDAETPGGKDAGCATFIDRQLAGPYGSADALYVLGPFEKGTAQQGAQSEDSPAAAYRKALTALNQHCQSQHGNGFAQLSADAQDQLLRQLEDGSVSLEGTDGKAFFTQLIKDVQMGFFADPIYGGNRDMCSWKMIGFPGARYDYREWVGRHNERFSLPPVSISGRTDWTPKG